MRRQRIVVVVASRAVWDLPAVLHWHTSDWEWLWYHCHSLLPPMRYCLLWTGGSSLGPFCLTILSSKRSLAKLRGNHPFKHITHPTLERFEISLCKILQPVSIIIFRLTIASIFHRSRPTKGQAAAAVGKWAMNICNQIWTLRASLGLSGFVAIGWIRASGRAFPFWGPLRFGPVWALNFAGEMVGWTLYGMMSKRHKVRFKLMHDNNILSQNMHFLHRARNRAEAPTRPETESPFRFLGSSSGQLEAPDLKSSSILRFAKS